MAYFDFLRLIKKYSSQFAAITLVCGYYDDSGDWVADSQEEINLEGAIISFKESKVYRSEGTLTSNDKRLFTIKPIDNKLHGAKIRYDGKIYSIEDSTENAKFTGVYAYTLKYVSAFKETAPDHDMTEEFDRLSQRLDGVLTASEAPTTDPETGIADDIESLGKRLDGEYE